MKNQFICYQALLFIFVITSCSSPKKTTEKPAETTTEVKAAPSDVKPEPSEVKPATDTKGKESMTGSQIVENAATSLSKKVGLSDTQYPTVKGILQDTFTKEGNSLDKTYDAEQAKIIKRDIIQKSNDQIMGVLNSDQKAKFTAPGQKAK